MKQPGLYTLFLWETPVEKFSAFRRQALLQTEGNGTCPRCEDKFEDNLVLLSSAFLSPRGYFLGGFRLDLSLLVIFK